MAGFSRIVILLFVLLFTVSSTAAAQSAEQAYQKAKDSYRSLLNSPKKQLYRHNWIKVIDRFLSVTQTFPKHRKAAAGLYMAGKAYQGLYNVSGLRRDVQRAVELYDNLAGKFPDDLLADDALVLSAEVQEKVDKNFEQAYLRYQKIVNLYPVGDMVSLARKKLAELDRYAPAKNNRPFGGGGGLPGSSSGTELTGVRFFSNPGFTRVVLDLSRRADYGANILPGDFKNGVAPRLYVDVKDVVPVPELGESTVVEDGLLRQIRIGRPCKGTVRIVFDLVDSKDYEVFSLEDPHRIVVDISGGRVPGLKVKQYEPHSNDGIANILQKTPQDRSPRVFIPSSKEGNGLRRIVVDAGHGGKDPGAIGPSGVKEKDITLAMAKALARRLEDELDCEVILTRKSDIFLPLKERTAIANRVGADLFISIHANACPNCNIHGIETYYLNFSKNDQAVAVAARENGTSLKEVGDLELILFDLMANSKINESSRLAAEIQKAMVGDLSKHYSKIKDLGVRQGPFHVLLGAAMPSVLVETAFISNKMEESRLVSGKFQKNTASAIARGIRNYATALKLIAAK
jgi:N-acetylmuramoyl-L-alanine amidase